MRALLWVLGISIVSLTGCGADPTDSQAIGGRAAAANDASKPSDPSSEGATTVADEAPGGTDWPRFLGPHGDSKSSEKGLIVPWPEEGPRIVWQKPLDEGYGIGSVANGRLFQYDRVGSEAALTAMDAGTGETVWEFKHPTTYADAFGYNGGPRCSPVIDEGRVYIYSAEGLLHCVSEEKGELIWKADASEQYEVVQNFFGIGSTPVVEGDLLIVMVGGSPPGSRENADAYLDRVTPNGTGVVAFDKRTGQVRYTIGDELASYAAPQLATINGRRWCFVFARGGLLGFEPSTGKIDFHYPWRHDQWECVNASTPVVVGDEVFISECYGPGSSLLKVRPGGFDVVWADNPRSRKKAMQTHWNTPIYHEGYLYGSSGRHTNNAELRCIEWKTGKVMWSEPDLTRASLLYVDGHFICLSEDGTLRLIRANPKKYELVSEATLRRTDEKPSLPDFEPAPLLKPPAWAAPILSHGLLYVRGADRLVCLEAMHSTKP